jgi:hypothetical protein
MSDVMPNYELEIAKLEVEIDQCRLNLKRQDLRELEIKAELNRLDVNRNALRDAIDKNKKNLDLMKEEHENKSGNKREDKELES